MNELQKRINKIRKSLLKTKCSGLLISSSANVRYLSGFTGGECWLLIKKSANFFIGDFRYKIQAEKELFPGFNIIICNDSKFTSIGELAAKTALKKLYFEAKHISFEDYRQLKNVLPKKTSLHPTKDKIEELRMIKSPQEIKLIKKAAAITKKSFRQLKPYIRPGVSELFLKNKLEQLLKNNGATGLAFEIIVASGENAAMPHARATNRKIARNEPIIIDAGAEYSGYKSDLTRTFFSGRITEYVKYYKLLASAQDRAIKMVRPGVIIQKIDHAARRILKKLNLEHYFGHALGHGIGLEVHEAPHVFGKSKLRFKPGMVFTVEPGIYMPGSGGTRIEDMILVTKKGFKII